MARRIYFDLDRPVHVRAMEARVVLCHPRTVSVADEIDPADAKRYSKVLVVLAMNGKFQGSLDIVATFALAIFWILLLLPWNPSMPVSGLDPSWIQVLGFAFVHDLQFGRDLIFTFGPLGVLIGSFYDPGTYWWVLIGKGTLVLALSILTVRLLRGTSVLYSFAAVATLSFAFLALALIFALDPLFYSAIVMSTILQFRARAKPISVIGLTLTGICAAVSLIKFTYFLAAIVAFPIVAFYRWLRFREPPLFLCLFSALLISFYVASGQRLTHFATFVGAGFAVAAGYNEAMQLPGAGRAVIYFCVVGLALVGVVGIHEWQRQKWWAVFPVSCLLWFGFVVAKSGFVRYDPVGHAAIAIGGLASIAILYVADVLQDEDRILTKCVGLGVVFLAAIRLYAHSTILVTGSVTSLRVMFTEELQANVGSVERLLFRSGKADLDTQYSAALASIRRTYPMPEIRTSVDIYPYDDSLAIAHKMNLDPRPVFQSYAAYTDYLVERNASFVRTNKAPKTIFFGFGPIDGRMPSMDDAASWPELLTRYRETTHTAGFVQLERSEHPQRYQLRLLSESVVRFGENIVVPRSRSGLVWARMDISQSVSGKLISFLAEPPILHLEISLADGQSRSFRLIPGIARGGFLFSPLIEDTLDFAALSSGNYPDALAGKRVTMLRLASGHFTRFVYRPEWRIAFYELAISTQSPEGYSTGNTH
jgi:hypothetical protein